MAALLGWVVLDQALTVGQLIGAAAVLGSVVLGASGDSPLRQPGHADGPTPARTPVLDAARP